MNVWEKQSRQKEIGMFNQYGTRKELESLKKKLLSRKRNKVIRDIVIINKRNKHEWTIYPGGVYYVPLGVWVLAR